MARLTWDRPEDRTFEVGVEKGALYVDGGRGVPWNGLISVEESTVEGDPTPRYQDGLKTHLVVPTQEFESTLTAFTYPEEFEACLGYAETYDGMLAGGQDRVPFGIAYQSRLGDGAHGDKRGVKVHLIYNAIATQNPKAHSTRTEVLEPINMSWGIQTAPVEVPGLRPTSHFILDSSRMGPRMFDYIYTRLYGAPGVNPRLLYPKDIFDISGDWHILYPSSTTYPSLNTTPGGP